MYLSVVIPAYNEEAKIARDIAAIHDFLSAQDFSSEVLIVNDGSTDDTQRVAEAHAHRYPSDKVTFRVLEYGKNRGKGYAVRHGVENAKGEVIAFADAGLCVPFKYLLSGIKKIREGADYAIASRRLEETKIHRTQPLYRKIGSRVFWHIMQIGMGVEVSDTQCGFKVYSAKAAKEIFSSVATDGFMFDIEALMVAKKRGFKVAEFPIEWSNDSDTRYNPFWGTLRNFRELAKIRIRT